MALWSNSDANTSAPKFAPAGGIGIASNGDTLFGNTQVGVFGVDTTEQRVAANKKGAHAGWVLRQVGTGPVATITANTGAYSPDGNVYLTFTGGGANTSANAQIVTNGSKQILSITVADGGRYQTTPTIGAVANSNAVFTIVMGGRANRVSAETLVAMGSMTGDASDDSTYADA
jgi:hypothetical protein